MKEAYRMNTRKTRLALLPLLLMLLVPFTSMAQDDTSTEEGVTYTVLTDCSDTGYDASQLPQNLFDGDMTTKWHINHFTTRGSMTVTFQASKPISVCGYQISTCEDVTAINLARNPKTWTLYGRNDRPTTKDGTDGWTLIDQITDDDKLSGDSKMTAEYSCKTTQKYEYFKWVITAVRDASNTDCMQASEFALISAEPYVEIASNTMYFRYGKKTANEGSTYYDITDSPTWNADAKSKSVNKAVFDEDFQYYKPTTCRAWFQDIYYLETLEGLKYLDTSEVTDMGSMFANCSYLEVLDLSTFNTAKVTDMSSMFSSCESLTEIILPATFTTDNVTNMYDMFWCCYSLKNINLSTFNTAQVTNMEGMFYYCENLTEINFPATFTAENVTTMKQMFGNCKKLTQIDLSMLNTARVTNMMYMFKGCTGFTELAFPATFSTESVTNMQEMFKGCSSLKVLDLTYFNTAQLNNIAWMFQNCSKLVTIFASDKFTTSRVSYGREVFLGCSALKSYITYDESKTDFSYANCTQNGYFTDKSKLGAYVRLADNTLTFYHGYYKLDDDWNLNSGTDAPGWSDAAKEITKVVFDKTVSSATPQSCNAWFSGCSNLTTIEGMENLNTAEVTDMTAMFSDCSALNSIDLSSLNTAKVTSMNSMFRGCSQLAEITFPATFTTDKVTDMASMFSGCKALTQIDLSLFNTAQVTSMNSMFNNCLCLTALNLSTFNTDNLTDMSGMFSGCLSLTQLDISKFNTAKVTLMEMVFNGCKNLIALNLPTTFTTEKVTSMQQLFNNCSSLKEINISTFNTAAVTDMSSMFAGCDGLTAIDFPTTFTTESVTTMKQMFANCASVKTLDLTGFNTALVSDMENMFYRCSNLVTIFAKDDFSVSSVTTDDNMFLDCSALKSYITYDASKISSAYANCTKEGYFTNKDNRAVYIRYVDGTLTFYYSYYKQDGDYEYNKGGSYPGWNNYKSSIQKVVFDESFKDQSPTTCWGWFSGCSNLTTIEGIENLNTSSTVNFTRMFEDCSSLTSLDLSGFDTKSLTIMNYTFYGCTNLKTIYVSDKFKAPSDGSNVFIKCIKLKGAISFSSGYTNGKYANYTTGYFTKKVGVNGGEIIGAVGSPLKAETLAVDDNKALTLYEDFTVGTATYSRTVSSEWGTLCLPIAVDLDATTGFKAYQLISNNDDTVELEELSGTLDAGTPVIIKMDEGNTTLSITTTNNTTAATEKAGKSTTDGTLHILGSYTQKMFTADDANCYIIKNNMLMNTAKVLETGKVSSVGIKPFRAYIIASAASIDAPRMEYSMVINGGTTAIDTVTGNGDANQPDEYYDLQGRRINNLQKGVNIVKRGNKTVKVLVR